MRLPYARSVSIPIYSPSISTKTSLQVNNTQTIPRPLPFKKESTLLRNPLNSNHLIQQTLIPRLSRIRRRRKRHLRRNRSVIGRNIPRRRCRGDRRRGSHPSRGLDHHFAEILLNERFPVVVNKIVSSYRPINIKRKGKRGTTYV